MVSTAAAALSAEAAAACLRIAALFRLWFVRTLPLDVEPAATAAVAATRIAQAGGLTALPLGWL